MNVDVVTLEPIPRGQYRIICVDGSEEVVTGKPTLPTMYKVVGNDVIDVVVLQMVDGEAETCMVVDDTGLLDGKPLNLKATAIYHAMRGAQIHGIHGDVVLINDKDCE